MRPPTSSSKQGLTAWQSFAKPRGELPGLRGRARGLHAIVTGFQLIGYYRPEWKHPVLYVVNALAMIAMVVCGVQLFRARKQ